MELNYGNKSDSVKKIKNKIFQKRWIYYDGKVNSKTIPIYQIFFKTL